MPEWRQKEFYKNCPRISRNLCDFAGWFVNTTNLWHGIYFTLFLAVICVFYSKKFFMYTYPTRDIAIGRYYAVGNPVHIFTGIPEHLPGHKDHMEEENIEILTRWGVTKIFWNRTKRMYKLAKKRKAKR
jgi:acetyltransferase-like isoleucine patch superfamily enzyme